MSFMRLTAQFCKCVKLGEIFEIKADPSEESLFLFVPRMHRGARRQKELRGFWITLSSLKEDIYGTLPLTETAVQHH